MAELPAERPAAAPPLEALRPFERFAFRLMRWVNTGWRRRFASAWQKYVLEPFFNLFVSRRLVIRGLERLDGVAQGAPILLVCNHRSFFDQFVVGWILIRNPPTKRYSNFPVRANFFYENPLGLLICLLLSGGSMFPPFFRRPESKAFNPYSLLLIEEMLRKPGQLIGFHPEGTRNKGPTPYELLRAQPGAGQLALKARPVIVPAFVTGLTNDIVAELKANLRRERPVVVVFGDPVDVSDWPEATRLSQYKRCSDALAGKIAALMDEEKAIRAGRGAAAASAASPSPARPTDGR
jgi:1-acyl-sn-glycerol-3-phosphate acyltransferase